MQVDGMASAIDRIRGERLIILFKLALLDSGLLSQR